MPLYQISAGQGPAECQLAVAKLLAYLQKRYNITTLDTSPGYHPGTYRSVRFSSPEDLSAYTGSIQWICPSPYRPRHKRKNWFIDMQICQDTAASQLDFDASKIVYTAFHCGGKGGQNVNKVASGVRAVYLPTGDVAEATEERSQHANKLRAAARLRRRLEQRRQSSQAAAKNSNWQRHTALQRGCAQRVFRGADFK